MRAGSSSNFGMMSTTVGPDEALPTVTEETGATDESVAEAEEVFPAEAEVEVVSPPPGEQPPEAEAAEEGGGEPLAYRATSGGGGGADGSVESTPSTWKTVVGPDAKHKKGKSPPKEVQGVQVSGAKKTRKSMSSLLKGGKKKGKKGAEAAVFEARAALAYYGTIGGGFGTPRLGVALGQFNVPAWVAPRPTGELVVASTFANEVQLLSARGGPMAVIRQGANGSNLLNPQGVLVSPDGQSMYVSDGGHDCVHRYLLQQGEFTAEPAACSDSSELSRPQGLVLEDGALFVASSGKHQIVVLDGASLKVLFAFGRSSMSGEPSKHELVRPSDLAVYRPPPRTNAARGPLALLYICDMGNHRISVYTTDGEPVSSFGSRGDQPGFFHEPLGIAIRDQRVFVAEGIGARLQVLEPDGTPLLVLPSPTRGRLVGVSWHESRLFVAEIEAHRLHVFKIID